MVGYIVGYKVEYHFGLVGIVIRSQMRVKSHNEEVASSGYLVKFKNFLIKNNFF